MGGKTTIKWSKEITTTLVEKLIQTEKDINKAVLVFDSATGEYVNGFRHDEKTFGIMISRLVSANQFRYAETLLNRMKEENCNMPEEIFLKVCRGYERVHKPLDAVRVFRKMKEFGCVPTQKSYISVLAILVGENRLKTAISFYRYMKEMGIPTSVVSLNVLIKCFCKNENTMTTAFELFKEMPNRGFMPDSFTYGTLINGLCRFGKVDEAKDLFREMERNGCLPSAVTYTNLINGLCQSGNLHAAFELFAEMSGKSVHPSSFTYASLMDALCKVGRPSQAMKLLATMVANRLLPNTIIYSILIHGHCKKQKLRVATELLDRMKLQGLKPDAGLYSKLIIGFCDISKFQHAANFLDEMVLNGVSPNRVTWSLHVKIYNHVVQGLCTMTDSKRAFQLYLSMRVRGINIDAKTFDSLLNYFCKNGDLHKASQIVDEMVLDGCVPDDATWNAVVGGFWVQKTVREAAESLLSEIMGKSFEPEI